MFAYELFGSRDSKNIGMQVFDEALNPILNGKFKMPYSKDKMENIGLILTNDGKVCLLAKVYSNEFPRESVRQMNDSYHFEVLIYERGTSTPKTVKITNGNYFSKDLFLTEDQSGNFLVTGLYGKTSQKDITGAYVMMLDLENLNLKSYNKGGYIDFPLEFLNSYSGIENLRINDVSFGSDGSIKILTEIYRYKGGASSTSTIYTLGDLIVISMKTGKLEWLRKIPKEQFGNDTYEHSFNWIMNGNDLHLFFRDHPKNSKLKEGEKPFKFDGRLGMLRGVSINATGEMKYYDIVNTDPLDLHLAVRSFKKDSNCLFKTESKGKINKLFYIEVGK